MKEESEMKCCLESGCTLVGLESNDDVAADRLLRTALEGYVGDIWEYDNARGGLDFRTKLPIDGHEAGSLVMPVNGDCVSMLATYLDRVITDCCPVDCVMVVRDVNDQLMNPQIVARIKAIAGLNDLARRCGEKYSVRIVVISCAVDIPPELVQVATVVSMSNPDAAAMTCLVSDFFEDNGIICEDGNKDGVVAALMGLTETNAVHVLSFVKTKDGNGVDSRFVADVRAEKARIVHDSGLLEIVDLSGVDCAVGGMCNLMAYIEHTALIFGNQREAAEFGVDMPKGILIAGMPGCGKSLAAKFAAKTFGIPLLRLDMGRLMGKYVGESERKLREALAVAEAAAPCCLWVDEVEKAFAGIGSSSDGGTATRLFGHFLSWMCEKTSPVYVIATANDITCLPPELMRRGRFDNLFAVELPDKGECRSILDIHLERRGHSIGDDEMDELSSFMAENGYCGADIERLVQTAIEIVFGDRMRAKKDGDPDWAQRVLDAADLRLAANLTHSVTEIMGTKIEELHAKLAAFRMDPAGSVGNANGRRC